MTTQTMPTETTPAHDPIERALDLIDQIVRLNGAHDLGYEMRKLHGIRDWALRRLGADYTIGDQVEICHDLFTDDADGRHSYAECARTGARARVVQIDYNLAHDYWYAGIVLEKEWQTIPSNPSWPPIGVHRYWHGPIDKTPVGMVAPSSHDQESHPEGRRHVFMVHVRQIRKAID